MSNILTIEALLYIPDSLTSYKEELERFIQDTSLDSTKQIDINFVNTRSHKTQIIISLVDIYLSPSDKEFHKAYQDRDFRFLFYYFQDIEMSIDDFDDKVFERVEFREELQKAEDSVYR